MILDRALRSLIALDGAATSRVLNLCAIARKNAQNAEHARTPLFTSPVLNTAIYIKHRLRSDETQLFLAERTLATKVIIPFDLSDLRAGGRSFFIRQKGFPDVLSQACKVRENQDISRDIAVLDMMDRLPSLDPFLLRERVRSENIEVDESYFSLSAADQEAMFQYCSQEVSRLVSMASGQGGLASTSARDSMVDALLSNRADARLDPLRTALGLSDHEFREGVFCWRGFLYYKWSLNSCTEQADPFYHSIAKYEPRGPVTADDKKFILAAKRALISGMREYQTKISATIRLYDVAYASMIERRDPTAFRKFLLDAPELFVELGEKIGVLSHILSFWHERSPAHRGRPLPLEVEDFKVILQDFTAGLGITLQVFA